MPEEGVQCFKSKFTCIWTMLDRPFIFATVLQNLLRSFPRLETRLREENFSPTIPVTTNGNRLQRCLTARNISSFVSPGNWLRIPSISEFSFNPCKWYSVKTTSMKGDTTFIKWLTSFSLSLSLALCAYMNNRRSYAPFVLCWVQFDS